MEQIKSRFTTEMQSEMPDKTEQMHLTLFTTIYIVGWLCVLLFLKDDCLHKQCVDRFFYVHLLSVENRT